MRVVIQRVQHAEVRVNGQVKGLIGKGLLVLAGFEAGDTEEDLEWMAGKVVRLRIFSDPEGKMNLSLAESGGRLLVVSQFTLHASTKKGNRPSWIKAAPPETAIPLYERFVRLLESLTGQEVETGDFGAYMEVELVNDGPVTIIIDSKNRE